MRIEDGYQGYVLDHHPFDVVGRDGDVYPWTSLIHGFEPIAGRIHLPPPGRAERSIGMTETHELAVVCDPFHPLRLTTPAAGLDDGTHMCSRLEQPAAGEEAAGVTSHL